MPSEIRRLVFFHSELGDALRVYGETHNVAFPGGKVTSAKAASRAEYASHGGRKRTNRLSRDYNVRDTQSAIIITFFDDQTFEHKYYNLTSDFVAAALVQYCLDNKIPLPRSGKKKLDLTEFNVCLDIVLDDDVTIRKNKG